MIFALDALTWCPGEIIILITLEKNSQQIIRLMVFTARALGDKNLVTDVRYSMVPNQIAPIDAGK